MQHSNDFLGDFIMFSTVVVFLLACIWAENCPLPADTEIMYQRCLRHGHPIPCGPSLQPGTLMELQCSDYYDLEADAEDAMECLENGKWNQSVPSCVPVCGKLSAAVPLIVKGKDVAAGIFPWHAALYHQEGGKWEFWCGGSLIASRLVLTAAHCTWQVKPSDLKVALGKKYREEIVSGEDHYQLLPVIKKQTLNSYQDVEGNYNGDLAVLVLEKPATISSTVAPVCIDWNLKYMEKQLVEGNTGVVLGWGLTENDTFSNELRAIRMPVMSDDKCIDSEQKDFRKYVTYTAFCAGFQNGSGVCNGDSGGGLTFLEPSTNTWYLQGVVSVSPRRRGTPWCDPNYYTVFTKVAVFNKWLRKMKELAKMAA